MIRDKTLSLFNLLKNYGIEYTGDNSGTAHIELPFNELIMIDYDEPHYRVGFYIGGEEEYYRFIQFSHLSDVIHYLKPLWKGDEAALDPDELQFLDESNTENVSYPILAWRRTKSGLKHGKKWRGSTYI